MERYDAPFKVIAFYWWPICLYSGWVTVACIANLASFLAEVGWDGGIFSHAEWTIIMISVTVVINIIMIYTRNMREFAAVGIWALFGIYAKHIGELDFLAYSALSGAILIGLNAAYHGFINRKTNPIYKIMHGQKA